MTIERYAADLSNGGMSKMMRFPYSSELGKKEDEEDVAMDDVEGGPGWTEGISPDPDHGTSPEPREGTG